ncbi:MAG: hypothetical protein JWO37_2790, partial [Acidimicrobiales bacterium]|nr:hypothetical protein [Acidimicrobiales bacterium]
MQVVFVVGAEELDIDVDIAGADALVADLVEALADGPVAPGTGLRVDGRFVDRELRIADAGLGQGASVELAHDPSSAGDAADAIAPPSPPAPVELCLVGGTGAGRRIPLVAGAQVIGREASADVVVDHPTVSARHARVLVDPAGGVVVTDLGSANGTRLDGAWVTAPVDVADGALLELGAVQCVIRPADRPAHDAARVASVGGHGTAAFNRPPRA